MSVLEYVQPLIYTIIVHVELKLSQHVAKLRRKILSTEMYVDLNPIMIFIHANDGGNMRF